MKRNLMFFTLLAVVFTCAVLYWLNPKAPQLRTPWFTLDQNQPYEISFGRGNALDYFLAIKVDRKGQMSICKREDTKVLGFTFELSPQDRELVNAAINTLVTQPLHKIKNSKPVKDGDQWILLIRQSERQKVGYFDNQFPPALVDFASKMDSLINRQDINWSPLNGETTIEIELWDAVSQEAQTRDGDSD